VGRWEFFGGVGVGEVGMELKARGTKDVLFEKEEEGWLLTMLE